MSNNSEIPYEFRASIFFDYVRIATASAIISAQYVERVFNGICVVLKPEGLRFSIEDFIRNLPEQRWPIVIYLILYDVIFFSVVTIQINQHLTHSFDH